MADKLDVKDDRKYTKDHEWALEDGDEMLIGVTAFAVDQLGDITLVEVEVEVGDKVEAGQRFGTIESVKTLSDLFAPIAGTLTRVNPALDDQPELVNEDCYGEGWMVAIKPDGTAELMDASDYKNLVEKED